MKKIIVLLALLFSVIESQALYYGVQIAIPEDALGGVVIVNGETPFPVGAIFPVPINVRMLPAKYLKVVGGRIVEKTLSEKEAVDLPAKQAAENAAAKTAKDSFDAQVAMTTVTPATLKGMLDALITQINQNEAFKDKPIDVKKVEAELATTISNRLVVAAEPKELGMRMMRLGATAKNDIMKTPTKYASLGLAGVLGLAAGFLLKRITTRKPSEPTK